MSLLFAVVLIFYLQIYDNNNCLHAYM